MAFAVKAVIDKAAAEGGPKDGDIWIFNDPYLGGTHLSDFRLVKPLFRGGEVFCYLASVGHWHDVGGNVPGNYNPVATESFQEGMLIPPVRLYADPDLPLILPGGKVNPDAIRAAYERAAELGPQLGPELGGAGAEAGEADPKLESHVHTPAGPQNKIR